MEPAEDDEARRTVAKREQDAAHRVGLISGNTSSKI